MGVGWGGGGVGASCCLVSIQHMIEVQKSRTSRRDATSFPGSLFSVSLGRWKTLAAAGHVTTCCDTNFSKGIESTNNFCRSQLKQKKGNRWSTSLC